MELESHFLSEAGGQIEAGKAHLPVMFKQVIQDLNVHKMCTLTESGTLTVQPTLPESGTLTVRPTLPVTLLVHVVGIEPRVRHTNRAPNPASNTLQCMWWVLNPESGTLTVRPTLPVTLLSDMWWVLNPESGTLTVHPTLPITLLVTRHPNRPSHVLNCVLVIAEGTTTTHLKLTRLVQDPEPVLDHQVPVFLEDQGLFQVEQWDLTTNQVLPYIDGFNHVSRIAAEADVDINLVKACVQNLVYYSVVTLIPIFQYSNVYSVTPKIKMLSIDKELQQRCIKFVSKSGL
uniref:Uncharacterized protein n=1 Tax=Timema tahoe TaxID=61484 RepID=A0A7R9IFL5_9NEOP|nr:unnamed protein product [Timema tahoe]